MIGFLFWFFLAFVVYTVAGYPILVGLASRLRGNRRWSASSAQPPVTLLIAAYNEEDVIGAKLRNSLELGYPRNELQILVAADGSDDGTCRIVSEWLDKGIELSYSPERRGKMAAINRAMDHARGDIIVFSDANNLYRPDCLRHLTAPFADLAVGAVGGAKRVIREKRGLSAMEGLYWQYESYIKASESRLGSCVAAVGEILAIRRSLFRPAPSHIVNDDFYIIMNVLKQGFRVLYSPQALSEEHVSPRARDERERRSRIAAGRFQALALASNMLPWRQPLIVWQVISHKFCRPFMSMALLGVFLCGILSLAWPAHRGTLNLFRLAPPYNIALTLPQAVFWGVGLIGFMGEMPGRLGKLFYLPTYLLNANCAMFIGLWRAIGRRQSVLWSRIRHQQAPVAPAMSPPALPDMGGQSRRNKQNRITILHLRASSGGGGGPDKTIWKTGQLIDKSRFEYIVAYMRRRTRSIAPLLLRAREAGLEYHEVAGGAFLDLVQLWKLSQMIRRRQVDILHCHDPKSDVYGVLLRLLHPQIRLMSTMHGWLPGKRRRITNHIDLLALRQYDCVLAVSQHTQEIAIRNGVSKAVVLHNAVDSDEWYPETVSRDNNEIPPKQPGQLWVGYVGRLSAEKGVLEFIRIAALVAAKCPKSLFLIAGEGPLRPEAEQLVSNLGLSNRASFLGRLDGPALLNLYQKLDVLVSPSWTEGLPNNVLEACATGTSVVASDVGGTGEIITHEQNGYLLLPGKIDEFANHTTELFSNPDLRERLGKMARQTVKERFSMSERTQRVEQFYMELIRARSRETIRTSIKKANL